MSRGAMQNVFVREKQAGSSDCRKFLLRGKVSSICCYHMTEEAIYYLSIFNIQLILMVQ
jgi:hypothetical protein